MHHPLSTSCFCALSHPVRISAFLLSGGVLTLFSSAGTFRLWRLEIDDVIGSFGAGSTATHWAPGMRDAKRCQAEPLVD